MCSSSPRGVLSKSPFLSTCASWVGGVWGCAARRRRRRPAAWRRGAVYDKRPTAWWARVRKAGVVVGRAPPRTRSHCSGSSLLRLHGPALGPAGGRGGVHGVNDGGRSGRQRCVGGWCREAVWFCGEVADGGRGRERCRVALSSRGGRRAPRGRPPRGRRGRSTKTRPGSSRHCWHKKLLVPRPPLGAIVRRRPFSCGW